MREPIELLRKANVILQREGLIPLVIHGFKFLFQYRVYYLYEHMMKERNEADFLPRIKDFTFKIVSTSQQADELAADGFDLPEDMLTNTKRRLDKGAIAFCVFAKGKLAHIGWVAMTEEAKSSIEPLPNEVDFSNKQAWNGGTATMPGYEGRGLMTYVLFKRLQFFQKKGIISSRGAIRTSNIASQRVNAKFNPKVYAKGRYLNILWWKSWKERPLP